MIWFRSIVTSSVAVCTRIRDFGVNPPRLTPYHKHFQLNSCQARRHNSGKCAFSDRLVSREVYASVSVYAKLVLIKFINLLEKLP